MPLNLRFFLSGSFSDISSFCVTCVACVYNCHQKNQSCYSKMGLTSHISDAYNAFLLFLRFFFFADEDVSYDESDDEGSGSGFTSSLCLSSFLNYPLIVLVYCCLK